MDVPILHQGDVLIASVVDALTDRDLLELRDRLVRAAGEERARGVIIDLTGLDVLDSFGCATLRAIAAVLRIRGSATVIVGIQPEVAFAMAQLGLRLDGARTALDLTEGLELLNGRSASGPGR